MALPAAARASAAVIDSRYAATATVDRSINQSINQSIMLFRVVQVTKSLQDPLEVGNSLLGISDNVRE